MLTMMTTAELDAINIFRVIFVICVKQVFNVFRK